MSLAAILEALAEAGATPAMLIAAVRADEAERSIRDDERRAKDAERQRRSRMSRGVTVTGRDSCDDPSPLVPPLEGSPGPLPKTPPIIPPSSPKAGARSRRCPDGWKPDPDLIVKLTVEGYLPGELERQLSRFRDHEFPRPYTDWPATFRNWVRRSPPEKATNVHRFDKSAAYLDSLKSVDAAMAEAVRQRAVRLGGG